MTNRPAPPPEFDGLAVEDKISYIQSLWDRVAADPEQVPVPDWHRQVLDDRLTTNEPDAEVVKPWRQVRDQIKSRLAREPKR